jgi:hypothetical protein
MTIDTAAEKLKASGWTVVETSGFLNLVGPLWQRLVNDVHEYAIVAQDKHHNRRGLVQGGLLMTFADRTICLRSAHPRHGPDGHPFYRQRQDRRDFDIEAARDPRYPQPDLHGDRGNRWQPLHRHGQRGIQDPEER